MACGGVYGYVADAALETPGGPTGHMGEGVDRPMGISTGGGGGNGGKAAATSFICGNEEDGGIVAVYGLLGGAGYPDT